MMDKFATSVFQSRLRVLAISAMMALAGCATRPSAEVLKPVSVGKVHAEKVTLLAATNRSRDAAGQGFAGMWAGKLSYERYEVSVPPERKGTTIAYPTSNPKPERQYIVTDREQLSQEAFVNAVTQSIGADGTIGIFVHGYNYSYQEALFRMAQMGGDAKTTGTPILFSWPSAAAVAGYVADRDAALTSRGDLDRLVKSLSSSGKVKRIVLFGHSMGGFLVMETVRELKLQGRDDVVQKLMVVLAAPDIDLDVFRAQLRDVGKMKTPITILTSKNDRALSASSLISGDRVRIGRIDIEDPLVRQAAAKEGVRVIDITAVQASDGLGHDRYASLAGFGANYIAYENSKGVHAGDVGAFFFDAAGAVVASPFRLAGRVIGSP